MKLKEIIAKVNKEQETEIDVSSFASKFGLDIWNSEGLWEQKQFKAYFFCVWYCTDTWVGGLVYFLNDEPVAVSMQLGRKCSEKIEWISQEAFDKTYKFLLTFLQESKPEFELCDLEQEMGEGHSIEFEGQVLYQVHKKATLNGVPVEILKPKDRSREICNKKITVIVPNGEEMVTDVGNLLMPFLIKE